MYHFSDIHVTIFINGLRIFLWTNWWNACIYLNINSVFCDRYIHLWEMRDVERPVGFVILYGIIIFFVYVDCSLALDP